MTLQSLGFLVTLWIHPFINDDCESFTFADQKGYFVKVKIYTICSKKLPGSSKINCNFCTNYNKYQEFSL